MLDKIEISLKPKYSAEPPFVSVKIDGDIIYEGPLDSNKGLVHNAELSESFSIEIDKRGKTKSLAKAGENQEVKISSLLLNGLSVHPDKFGKFYQNGNAFVGEKIIDGDTMALNGVWKLDLPIFRQPFAPDLDPYLYREKFSNTDIACFGCSFTWGWLLNHDQTWPYYLSNTKSKNYGVGGNSISSIIGTAHWFAKNFECNQMILLLPHPCRLQVKDNDKFCTLLPGRTPEIEKKFETIQKVIAKHGETSLLISGYANTIRELLSEINTEIQNLYITSYQEDLYKLLPTIVGGTAKVLPFYNLDKNLPLASDNEHPGPDHNRIFANQIRPIIGG